MRMRALTAGLLLLPAPLCSQSLEVGDATMSFGALDGPDDRIIGRIEDVAVNGRGDIFVTDALQMRIGWVRSDGTLMGWFGRAGDGPEEFRWLGSVDVAPDGRVVAADVGHRRFVYFSLGEAGLSFDRVIRVPMIVSDFCFLGEGMFVLSHHEGRILHELDREGAVLRSFGEPLETPFRVDPRFQVMIDGYSASGELLCLGDDLLVVLPHILPEVRAFRRDGSIAWTHALDPYARTTPTQTERGTVQMRLDPRSGTVHQSVSLWLVNDSVVATQLVEAGFPSGPDEGEVEVRFLDVAFGDLLSSQVGVPRIFARWEGEFVAWEAFPFPRIVRYSGVLR